MPDNVYQTVELTGTSVKSTDDAIKTALARASSAGLYVQAAGFYVVLMSS
jgi:flavin-binding protein dodecin